MNNEKLEALQKTIGYQFKNKNLLLEAVTHSSYVNNKSLKSYERLEFFGDSILGFIIAERVFMQDNQVKERDLTKSKSLLVQKENLNAVAKVLNIEECLLAVKGTTGKSIGEDMVESLIAAIYLDGGLEPTRQFVDKFIKNQIASTKIDYKSLLNEEISLKDKKREYKLLQTIGKDHQAKHECGLYINGELVSRAQGESRDIAEQECAKLYLESIK